MLSCQSPPGATHCDAVEDSGGLEDSSQPGLLGKIQIALVGERCRGPDKADTGDR